MIRLIVGLGNPQPHRTLNRHNIGFLFIDELLKRYSFNEDKINEHTYFINNEMNLILMKPSIGMNESGIPVSLLANKFNLKMNEILIVSDDMDSSLGKIKKKMNAGHGGHNGIKSIENELNTLLKSSDLRCPKLKIGIGRPTIDPNVNKGQQVLQYVLSDFTNEELNLLNHEMNLFLNQNELNKLIQQFN